MIKAALSKIISFSTSSREKQRDYQNVVITQVIIIVFGILLSEYVISDSTSFVSKVIIGVFSGFGVVYLFLMWDLLRNFTKSKLLVGSMFVVLASIAIIGTLAEFPFYQVIKIQNRQLFLLVIHLILFPIEVTVIIYAIRDIFTSKFLTPDKLWGSACVYLMISISFGSLYDLVCIAMPGSLGVPIELGFPNYSACVSYSLCALGGIDTGFPDAIKLIKNISIFEAVWGNLFTVLIIGKLMGLPRQDE